jgi:ribosome-associated heat shock protein Hsp15
LTAAAAERTRARLDQWLWFARLAKSRSLAARLCADGAITLNGVAVGKANQLVRIGDIIGVPQGRWQRTARVVALGVRRGPASEARRLYEEVAPPARLRDLGPEWAPLLADDDDAGFISRVAEPLR